MTNLMEATNTHNAAGIARRLGAAAKTQGLPRNPWLIPGFADVLGGLNAEDPIAAAVTAAYGKAYDEAGQVPA